MGVSIGLLVDCVWNGRSDLHAGVEIYYREHPCFWLILSSQNGPLLKPEFHSPVWSIGGPICLCPWKVRTYFQVVHWYIGPRFHLLSLNFLALPWRDESQVGATPILVILAS